MIRNIVAVFAVMLAFEVSAEQLVLTWAGGSHGMFSEKAWSGGIEGHETPQNGDSLVFPRGGCFTNDIDGLKVAGVSVTAADSLILEGRQMTILGGGAFSNTGSSCCSNNIPLIVGTEQGQTVCFNVAQNKKLTLNACISGLADLVHNNDSAFKGTLNLCADSDYTGKTTLKNGKVNVYADGAFGSAEGGMVAVNETKGGLVVRFHGVTMSENIDISVTPTGYNPNAGESHSVGFFGNNTFNGSWVHRAVGMYYVKDYSTNTFNGVFSARDSLYLTMKSNETCKFIFNGEGSSFATADYYYTANITYSARCKSGNLVFTRASAGEYSNWCEQPQKRYFNCENAMLYDPAKPAAIIFTVNKSFADMCGFDQTFSYVECNSASCSMCVINSELPSVVHLTLADGAAVTNYAKCTGKVSLSFEGPRPVALGNSENTSTGSLVLDNGSAVTLLDGFKWSGNALYVNEGSTLKVEGDVELTKDVSLSLMDKAADGDEGAKASQIFLEGNMYVDTLTINGRKRSGGRTYGSSLSTADVKDDVHFAGTGVVRVRRPVGFIVICQ
jgi:hypothetical protein